MLTEILRDERTAVQPNFEEIPDSYESLIAELHRFLDRLIAEPREHEDFDPEEIFMRRDDRE